ncbi:MAG: hypothetical protein CMM07_25590 [Rhodopirellula sp.]|nr:hypothetical protein [Rhodopirellula sp.]
MAQHQDYSPSTDAYIALASGPGEVQVSARGGQAELRVRDTLPPVGRYGEILRDGGSKAMYLEAGETLYGKGGATVLIVVADNPAAGGTV